jgi:hypothetical protein
MSRLYVEVPDALEAEINEWEANWPGVRAVFEAARKKLQNEGLQICKKTKQGNYHVLMSPLLRQHNGPRQDLDMHSQIHLLMEPTSMGVRVTAVHDRSLGVVCRV